MRLKDFIKISFQTICIIAACGLMSACGNKPSYDGSELTRIKQLYAQAAKAQKQGDYDKAKILYDRLLHCNAPDTATYDSVLPIASKAVTQIMNTMQSQGKPEECVRYLRKLKHSHNVLLGDLCQRDISVTLAYALSRTEDVEGAGAEMDKAMRMTLQRPTHDRLFRDYAYAMAVYFCLPDRKDDVNRYGTMALREVEKCENKSGESWVTAILGMSYIRNGDLSNAINMFKQSYTNATLRNDTLSMANTLNLMANIMINWNLFDYANDYASRAVAISDCVSDKNPKICSNILANKALVMQKFGYADSARYYLEKAYKYTKDLPYNSGNSDIDLIRGELLAKGETTHRQGMDILYNVARKATSGISTKAYYLIAQEHMAHGETAAGEAALDSTVKTMSINTSPILMNNIYEYALDYYVTTDNRDKIVRLARDLNRTNKNISNSDILKQTAESIVEFKTQERTDELDWQQMQIEQKKKFMVVYTIVVLILLIGITATLLIKRRYAMLQQKYAEQQLENLSYRLEAMANDKQRLADQLRSQQLLNTHYPAEEETTDRDFSHTRINDREGENRFREMFKQLHPGFIDRLRSDVPGISRREELLAMLIALRLDNSQIENIMCIARSSINMARYRLRAKMQLNREDSLEEAIMKILTK